MATTRMITNEERNAMNEIIRPGFGPALQIRSGSYEEDGNGAIRYNLVIGNPSSYVSEANKLSIAKKLKENFRDDAEYFSGGSRLA